MPPTFVEGFVADKLSKSNTFEEDLKIAAAINEYD